MANGGAPLGPGDGNVYLGGGQWGPKGSYDPTNPSANFGGYTANDSVQALGGGTWGSDFTPGALASDWWNGIQSEPGFFAGGINAQKNANQGTAQITPLGRQLAGQYNPLAAGAGSNQPFDEKSFWGNLSSQLTNSATGYDQTDAGLKLKQALQGMSDEDKMATLKSIYGGDVKKADLINMGAARDKAYGQALRDVAKQRYGAQTAGAHAQYQGEVQKIYSDAAAASGGLHQGSSDQQNVAAQGLVKDLVGAQADEKELDARGVRYMQMADELAAKNGVDRQQLLVNLNDGLRQLGLDQSISAADLLVAQGSNDAQRSAAAQAIVDKLTNEAQSGVYGGPGPRTHIAAAPAGHPSGAYTPPAHARFS